MKDVDYGYAIQRLRILNNKLLISGKPLKYDDGKQFTVGSLSTKIRSSDLLLDENQYTIEVTNEEDLSKLGYCVMAENVMAGEAIYFFGQKKKYYLEKAVPHIKLPRFPEGHYVKYDVVNKTIKLVGRAAGPLGSGPRLKLQRKSRDPIKDHKGVLDDFFSFGGTKKKVIDTMTEIPEVVIGISEEGELICLPREMDEPTVGIIGMRGSGKSFCMHGLADRGYWKWGKKIVIMNDSINECSPWSLSWMYEGHSELHSFAKQLKKIGEDTRPLPCVFISPTSATLDDIPIPNSGVSFKMSFPFKHLVANYNYYLKDRKDLKMVNTGRYFRHIADEIAQCKTIDEIETLVDSSFGKQDKGVKGKIITVMQDLFDLQFLDVNTGVPSKWAVELSDGHTGRYSPVASCLLAGVVPVLETADLNQKDHVHAYFKYMITDIFTRQKKDPYFIAKGLQIWLFIDELQSLVTTSSSVSAKEIIERCATEGRPARIGLVYCTQNYTKIPLRITSNTKYLIVCGMSSKKEIQKIGGDWNLTNHQMEKISELETFEALFMTKTNFVCYDSDGRRRTTDKGEVLKGKILPPLSMHKAPSSGKET